jgi:hypothetical protein
VHLSKEEQILQFSEQFIHIFGLFYLKVPSGQSTVQELAVVSQPKELQL